MKKILLIIAIVVPVAGGIWFYSWWSQPPSTNKVTVARRPQEDVLGSSTTIRTWSTLYFTSAYPSNFRIRNTNEVTQGNRLGQYMLSSTSIDKTDQLAVTVAIMPEDKLADLSDIKVRLLQPDMYIVTQKAYAPSGALVISRVDGTETAVFMKQGNRYASVVVSGSSTRQQILEQGLQTVVANWLWQ